MIALESIGVDTAAFQNGEKLYRRGLVSQPIEVENGLRYEVGGSDVQSVTFTRRGEALCTCGETEQPCQHVTAALLRAESDGTLKRFQQENELALGQRMLSALNRAMPGGETVRLLAVLRLYEDGRIGLGLSAGQERLYAVKNIADLLACFVSGTELTLSPKFTYRPDSMRFSREDERFLTALMSYIPLKNESEPAVLPEGAAESDAASVLQCDGRFVLLTGPFLQSVMRYLENYPFQLQFGEQKQMHSGIRKKELPLCFTVSLTPTELLVSTEGTEQLRMITPDARYVLLGNTVTHLYSSQARVCRLLLGEGSSFRYPARNAEEVLSVLLPALSAVGSVVPSPELRARLVSEPLKPVAYLDLVDGNVEARMEFHYGETVVLPFALRDGEDAAPAAQGLPDGRMLLRDGREEGLVLDLLADFGFVVHKGRIILRRSREILYFCTQGFPATAPFTLRRPSSGSSPAGSRPRLRSICGAGGWYSPCWRTASPRRSFCPS